MYVYTVHAMAVHLGIYALQVVSLDSSASVE